nr:alpha amylase C-terminal domain-containing protein [Lachnospiraceae bacterium]
HAEALSDEDVPEQKLFGEGEIYYSTLRVFLAWLIAHPGRKLLFLGDGSVTDPGTDGRHCIDWDKLKEADHKKIRVLLKALLKLYRTEKALYMYDDDETGFEWINCLNPERCVYSFMRKTDKENETVVVIVNFAGSVQEVELGVPYDGRYNVLLDTDQKKFGGQGVNKEKSVRARSVEVDGRPFSIDMTLGPQSALFMRYTPYDDKERSEIALEKAEEERVASAAARKEARKYKGAQDEAQRRAAEAEENLEAARKSAENAEQELIKARNHEKIVKERGERETALARRKIEEARISAERTERNVNDRNAAAAEQVRIAEEVLREARNRIELENTNLKNAGEDTENASRNRQEAVRKASEADERMKQFQEIAFRAVKAAGAVGKKAKDTADSVGKKAKDTADSVGKKARSTADAVGKKVSRKKDS